MFLDYMVNMLITATQNAEMQAFFCFEDYEWSFKDWKVKAVKTPTCLQLCTEQSKF